MSNSEKSNELQKSEYPHLEMSPETRKQEGSPAADRFRLLHKRLLDRTFFAIDMDLVLVEKKPYQLVAVIDYKQLEDKLTYAEIIAYNELVKMGVPVFVIHSRTDIVSTEPEEHRFDIYRYLNGDPWPTKPIKEVQLEVENVGWDGIEEWEKQLRKTAK